MITKASKQYFPLRIFPEYGDAAILHLLFTSEFWKNLFIKNKLATFQLFKSFLYWNMAMFMSIATMLFRYQHGQRTTGFILYLSTLVTLVVYNSTEIVFFLKPLAFPVVLALPFFIKGQVWDWVFTDIQSPALLVFTGLYALMGVVQCVFIYAGKGNSELNKRGNSYLFLLLHRFGLKNELVVQAFIEPVVLGFAAWFLYTQGDIPFAIVLGFSALSLFFAEIMDYAHTEKSMNQRI